jgi:hypothetical protein
VNPTQAPDPHTCRLDGEPDRCSTCQSAPSGEAMSKGLRAMGVMETLKCSKREPCDLGHECFSHRMARGRFLSREGSR